ncbi:MAG: translation elongation factor-like protein [Anaerolineae bacterium]
MAEVLVGNITHYYTRIGVAVVELTDVLKRGDPIHIKGATTDFEQEVKSMQIEHGAVEQAEPGRAIGLKVDQRVREGDTVYKIVED